MIPEDILFLDIETLPTLDPDLIAEARASVEPPANYSRPEAIEKWWAEKGEAAREKAVRATSLDGGTGRLAALSWAWGSGTIMGAHTALDNAHSIEQERRLIKGFFAELEAFHRDHRVPPTLVGHNVVGFDIRWLWKRAIVLGIRPPAWWAVDARPWDHGKVQDTMILWEGSKGRISQDRLARTLGLAGKGAIDGSMVANAWEEGRHEEIREYNVDDVRTVRRVWCRIVGEDAPVEEDEVEVPVGVVQLEPVEVVVPEPVVEMPVENAQPKPVEIDGPVGIVVPEPEVEVPIEIKTEPEVEAVVEKPKVARPKVVPVFLLEDFPEEEVA